MNHFQNDILNDDLLRNHFDVEKMLIVTLTRTTYWYSTTQIQATEAEIDFFHLTWHCQGGTRI